MNTQEQKEFEMAISQLRETERKIMQAGFLAAYGKKYGLWRKEVLSTNRTRLIKGFAATVKGWLVTELTSRHRFATGEESLLTYI